MQLADVLQLVALEGARRHVEKRAGILLPLTVGAMIPGIAKKAIEKSHTAENLLEGHSPKLASTSQALTRWGSQGGMAAGQEIGGGLLGSLGSIAGAPGQGIAKGLSNLVQKKLFGQELGERHDAMGIMGQNALKSFGGEIGKSSVGLLRDMALKAMDAVGHAGDASAREAILGELKRTDSVLAQADDKLLMESYHTMTRFAPTLSTDKNAVRSFLRQSVMSGAGPDFMTIKHIADSERAVTGDSKGAR